MKFIRALFGGFAIGLGGASYLSVDNRIIGALLFSIGLLLVCFLEFDLYTGKVSYLRFTSKGMQGIGITLLGNLIGAAGFGIILSFMNPAFHEKAMTICELKVQEQFMVIPLAIFCNVLIFFAVETFKRNMAAATKIVITVLCVMTFILCGFEHSIANMFYFGAARTVNSEIIFYLLLNIIFNGIGGITSYRLIKTSKGRV